MALIRGRTVISWRSQTNLLPRRKVVQRALVALALLFYVSIAQAGQWFYKYKLIEGRQFSLCRDYVENLKTYVEEHPDTTPYDLSCRLKVAPDYHHLFKPVRWSKVDAKEHMYWFREARKVESSLLQKEFDEKAFQDYMADPTWGINGRDFVMWMSNFDFDFNGSKEWVLQIDPWGDCTDPNNKLLNQRNGFGGNTNRHHYMLMPDKKHIDPYGIFRTSYPRPGLRAQLNSIYFFYKGRTFEANWRGFFSTPRHLRRKHDFLKETAGEPAVAFINIHEPHPRRDGKAVRRNYVCNIRIDIENKDKEILK